MSETDHSAPPPAAAGKDDTPASERMMGLFGLVCAVGLALIAADLLSGGALSRMVRARGEGDGDDAAGG